MKYLTIIFAFFSTVVSAQTDSINHAAHYDVRNGDTINFIDNKGLRQGFWIAFGNSFPDQGYRDDQIVQTGYYVNSQPDGKWVKYWPSGNVAQRIYYKNGVAEGRYTNFYQSGNIEEDGQWWSGHPVGFARKYYETGMISLLEQYDSTGAKTGKYERFDLGGTVTFRGAVELDAGIQNGTEKEAAEQLRKAGKLEVLDYGQYKGEMLWNGRSYVFDNTDNCIRINVYREGKLFGDAIRDSIPPISPPTPAQTDLEKCVEYNDAGKLIRDGLCKGGKIYSGKIFIYDLQGNLEFTRIFRKGRMIAELDEKSE